MAQQALSRFKILDLTRVRAGPTCVRQLADHGAVVIKVEAPDADKAGLGGPRHGSDFQNLHRNKRSISLDLKSAEGVAILKQLAAWADVLVENFRPDVKDRLGIGYEALKTVNPRLVYASMSGFGEDGPYRMRPGFDQIAQGMGGLMQVTGKPGEGPMRAGIPLADLTTGHLTAQGILIALLEREVSGEGQWIQTSLLASQIAMMDFQATRWLMDHEVPKQAGNDHPTNIPTGVFATSDGYINIATAGTPIFIRLCKAMGLDDVPADPRYATMKDRSANRHALNARIEEVTKTDTSAAWVDRLNSAEVPAGPIYRMDEVFADPQVQHLGMSVAVEHPTLGTIHLVNQPIKLSRTPASVHTASPELGEHTDAVLGELGFSADEIATLRSKKVI